MSPEYEYTPFGHALLALYCDARQRETSHELVAKFGLSERQTGETVRAAHDYMMMDIEARNPEAWKKLGLKTQLRWGRHGYVRNALKSDHPMTTVR